ncbi:MAG: GLPGLI family protein [Candidatus Cryptobacteroides sp.]
MRLSPQSLRPRICWNVTTNLKTSTVNNSLVEKRYKSLIRTMISINRSLAIVVLFLSSSLSLGAQGLRVTYEYWYKMFEGEKGYHKDMNMTLDAEGGRMAFYSEVRFQKDSIEVFVFDDSGNVKNEDAYAERLGMGTCFPEYQLVDLNKSELCQKTRDASLQFVSRASYEIPEWKLEDEQKEFRGYMVKKASCDYYGRSWIAWYCEDIPVSAGPWLLHGLPGLVIHAYDSESQFGYKCRFVEPLESGGSRYDVLLEYCNHPRLKCHRKFWHEGSLEQMTKLRESVANDEELHSQLSGHGPAYIMDKSGKLVKLEQETSQFMIPMSYWK